MIISAIIVFVNMFLNKYIAYYESPEGFLARINNDSAEKEYREIVRTRNTLIIIGSASLIASIAGFGVYVTRYIKKDKAEDVEEF
jgi:hypothetical protein